jgi:hypothetical protein
MGKIRDTSEKKSYTQLYENRAILMADSSPTRVRDDVSEASSSRVSAASSRSTRKHTDQHRAHSPASSTTPLTNSGDTKHHIICSFVLVSIDRIKFELVQVHRGPHSLPGTEQLFQDSPQAFHQLLRSKWSKSKIVDISLSAPVARAIPPRLLAVMRTIIYMID